MVGRRDVTLPATVSPTGPVTTIKTRGDVTVSKIDASPDWSYRLEPCRSSRSFRSSFLSSTSAETSDWLVNFGI